MVMATSCGPTGRAASRRGAGPGSGALGQYDRRAGFIISQAQGSRRRCPSRNQWGRIDPRVADQDIKEGRVDMSFFARRLIADPSWPKRRLREDGRILIHVRPASSVGIRPLHNIGTYSAVLTLPVEGSMNTKSNRRRKEKEY